jgi:hypothetical protein
MRRSHTRGVIPQFSRWARQLLCRVAMTYRRIFLLLGLLGLILSAARPAISAPADLEATGYGGSASGGWACGPNTQAKYGGVGGEIRVRPGATKPDDPEGASVSLGVAGEHVAFTLLDCGGGPCNSTNNSVPPAGTALGASAKGGYDWKWVGFRVGVLPWQSWFNNTDTAAKWNVWPEASLRVGPVTSLRGEIGVGEYGVQTILRPGAWAGVAYVPDPGWELALHGGVASTMVGDMLVVRGDLGLKLPITKDLQLGVGSALSSGLGSTLSPEGRISLIAHAW